MRGFFIALVWVWGFGGLWGGLGRWELFVFRIYLELAFPCFSGNKIRPVAAFLNFFSLQHIHFPSESVKFP